MYRNGFEFMNWLCYTIQKYYLNINEVINRCLDMSDLVEEFCWGMIVFWEILTSQCTVLNSSGSMNDFN